MGDDEHGVKETMRGKVLEPTVEQIEAKKNRLERRPLSRCCISHGTVSLELVKDLARMIASILNDRAGFFVSMLRFALDLRNGGDFIFREMRDMVALCTMRRLRVRTAHTSFSHQYHLCDRVPQKNKIM